MCSFRKKISSVNSQLSKEINFKILFRNLQHVLFCEISLMECSDWSVGQCLQTSNETSSMLAFESIFPMLNAYFRKRNFEIFILK